MGVEMRTGVLLATFNGEKYLREQLNSILHQSIKVDEIIISDDGSTDNTKSIVNEYIKNNKNVVIKFVENKGIHGVPCNFENAFRHSSADFLFFSDQDDVWKKDKVAVFLDAVKKYPEYGLYFSNATLTDSELEPIGKSVWDIFFINNNIDSLYCALYGEVIIKRLSYYGNFVTGMSSAVRRDVLEKVFPLKPTVLQDEIITYYCSINGGLVAINEETAFYRQHDQNALGLTGSMFVSKDKRRDSIYGLIKNSDQNMPVVSSMFDKSKYFFQFDIQKQYSFLEKRYRFYKERRDIAKFNKFIALIRLTGLLIKGGYKKNEHIPLKSFVLDASMIAFVSTKKRRLFFQENDLIWN